MMQIKMEGKYGDLRRQSEWKEQGQMERLREEEKEEGKRRRWQTVQITGLVYLKYFKILRKER